MAGTRTFQELGAGSVWGACFAMLIELIVLLWPRSIDFIPVFPKYVVGVFGLLMAIAWLDGSLITGRKSLSQVEYIVVVFTLIWSAIVGLLSGIAVCWGCTLLLLMQALANRTPVTLDSD